MPIVHLYLPEQRGLLVNPQRAEYRDQIIADFLGNGAVFSVYEPHDFANITPGYWQDPQYNQYVLEMKQSAEAAKVHIFPNLGSDPIASVKVEADGSRHFMPNTMKNGPIHIPAHVEGIVMGHKLSKTSLDVGGIVMRVMSPFLEQFADRRITSGP